LPQEYQGLITNWENILNFKKFWCRLKVIIPFFFKQKKMKIQKNDLSKPNSSSFFLHYFISLPYMFDLWGFQYRHQISIHFPFIYFTFIFLDHFCLSLIHIVFTEINYMKHDCNKVIVITHCSSIAFRNWE